MLTESTIRSPYSEKKNEKLSTAKVTMISTTIMITYSAMTCPRCRERTAVEFPLMRVRCLFAGII